MVRLDYRVHVAVLAGLSLVAACSKDEAFSLPDTESRERDAEVDAEPAEHPSHHGGGRPDAAPADADTPADAEPHEPSHEGPSSGTAGSSHHGGAGTTAHEPGAGTAGSSPEHPDDPAHPDPSSGAAGSTPNEQSGAAGAAGGAGAAGSVPHSHTPPVAGGGGSSAPPEDDDAGVDEAAADAGVDAGGAGEGGAGAAGSAGTGGVGGSAGESGAGAGGMSGAGAGGSAGEGGAGGGGMSGSSGAAGAAGEPAPTRDHCVEGELVSPADATLPDEPTHWVAADGDIDLVLPGPVLDWMNARDWLPSHDAWHNIRRCNTARATSICEQTALVPASQQCSGPDDGYQFLAMHRHMIQALKQAFPQHAHLFTGFERFPLDPADVPEAWRDRFGTGWSQAILDTAAVLEDIENRLDQFPTEGDLGQYIQCGAMSRLSNIHGAMHFKWAVSDSPYSLGRQNVNLANFMFWKLHGWIDDIWERYRVAKGLAPDEPALKAALAQQCHEMHALAEAVQTMPEPPPMTEPLPEESGLFHETVRPIFQEICSSCHSETSPEAGMSLGGQISSTDVVANLVNVPATHGGQYMRIAPGLPEQSWLYLKVSGLAAEAGCVGEACNPQTMPPTGQVTLTQPQLDAIRAWIAQGAPVPTLSE